MRIIGLALTSLLTIAGGAAFARAPVQFNTVVGYSDHEGSGDNDAGDENTNECAACRFYPPDPC